MAAMKTYIQARDESSKLDQDITACYAYSNRILCYLELCVVGDDNRVSCKCELISHSFNLKPDPHTVTKVHGGFYFSNNWK